MKADSNNDTDKKCSKKQILTSNRNIVKLNSLQILPFVPKNLLWCRSKIQALCSASFECVQPIFYLIVEAYSLLRM